MTDPQTTEVRGLGAGYLPLLWEIRKYFVTTRGEPIPPAERLTGIDTSKWSGLMNWQTAYNAGARFAYFKATQGTTIADVQFPNSRNNCTQMPWGAYHYLTTANGTTQANWFCDTVGDDWGELPPVVDVELPSLDSAVIYQYAYRINARLGQCPMVYTSAYFWDKVTGGYKSWVAGHCQLWVAHWNTLSPILPTGWSTYAVHQYSADGNGLGHYYGTPPEGEEDMDLNYTRRAWLAEYDPEPTLEERVADLERRVTLLEQG